MSGNRLADAVSPYLRSHAGNPVDWYPWSAEAFAAAAERDVPVLVSVGYATCHWCHVMARESFSDPALAARVNDGFVAIKVDREEHPEVDAACLAAAGAFTPNLGWPLNVFMTPSGRVFHAGTYSPPRPVQGHASFGQVLDAVREAWTERRDEVERSAAGLAAALAGAEGTAAPGAIDVADLQRVIRELASFEDHEHGGFGGAPKFPTTPVLLMLLALGRSPGLPQEDRDLAGGIAGRALAAVRGGGLRDPVEGGFFRYATRRDWTEPHYERMLTDNALLLRAAAQTGDRATATGIVGFLERTLQRPDGGFGSGQDSESDVDGVRSEGGYYALDAAARARQPPPAVDAKVLTGWNGLAIGALAVAGSRFGEPGWIGLAVRTAEAVLARHLRDGRLLRASLDGRASDAVATLDDRGALTEGLLEVALAAGRPDLATVARELVDGALVDGRLVAPERDPVLDALGVPVAGEDSEGAAPSGATSISRAARLLFLLTGITEYAEAAAATLAPLARGAIERPIGAGGVLGALAEALEPVRQVVVVTADPADPLVPAARALPSSVTAVADDATAAAFAGAGFELFEGRTTIGGRAAAYICHDFVCRLPVTDPAALA